MNARSITALVAASVLVVTSQATAQPQSGRILVMPFENASHDSRIVWLGEAASVLLADDLNALGAAAITRDERREAFERLRVPPAASLSDATVIRIGQLVRASQVVMGSLTIDGDVVIVTTRAITLDTAKVSATVTERSRLTELFSAFERVARRIAPASSRTTQEIEHAHPPIAAFENYIKGLLAETPATAIGYLESALSADPTFERVRLALWEVFDEQGEHEKALAAVRAVRPSSPLGRGAQFRTALSQINLERYSDAFATLKELSDRRPTAAIMNNLGVVQMRRGSTPTTGLATYYFTKAIDADATEPDYFFNLGYAYWLDHDAQAAVYWLREALRRNPTDGDAHYVLGAALAAAGEANESAREKELARRLSSAYEEWDKRPANDPVPKRLERIRSDVELPHSRQIEQVLANNQTDQKELATYYLERAKRLADEESDRAAMDELNRVLFLSPYSAEAHVLLGTIHLRAGRTSEAIDALKLAIWSDETADANALLAEAYLQLKDVEASRQAAERALRLQPTHERAQRILASLPAR